MYEFYETGELTAPQMVAFRREFDKRVGTGYEVNEVDLGVYCIFCFELTRREANICRDIEKTVTERGKK